MAKKASSRAASAPPPPCPRCGNPRTVADTDRLCEKCRSVGQPHWAGTLLELRVTLEANPSGLDSLSYWQEIRNFGRSVWEQSAFDKDPIQLLSDWLIAEHGKGLDCDVLCTPRSEVAALLRAAVKGKQHTKPAHSDENAVPGPTPKKPRKRKRNADPKAKEKRDARQEQQKADKRLSEAWAGGMGQHKTKVDLAREKGMKEKEVIDALERHRKRLERAGKKRPRETPQ